MAEENKNIDIVIVQPPIALMILPVITGGLGLYFAKSKKNMNWGQSILVGLSASVIGSIPSWIWAYNINKQYVLQTEKVEVESEIETK